MTFAIIETGGKQYRVKEGDIIKVETLPEQTPTLDRVLLIDDGKETRVGKPYLDGVSVEVKHRGTRQGKKVTVIHYKAKVRHKKTYGHRQLFSEMKIEKINL